MSHFDSTFGVEIECFLPEGSTMQMAAQAVVARLGAPCNVEHLNKVTKTFWKVVPDGSLGSRGAEFVSPILRGEDGLRQVDTVMQALADFGCSVSRQCGLHVHVGCDNERNVGFFKNLVKLYSVYEPVIDSLVPASRRASSSQWCRSITSARPASVDSATNLDALIVATTGMLSQSSKYFKLNLLPVKRQRTVEFRQHSGTLDGRKASMWIVLCLRMVATAKGNVQIGSTGQSANRARRGSKAHRIGEMFLRAEGVTGREVCREMGWPSVSMPAQARAAGIDFTTQRMGREVRYFARSAQEATPSTPITVDGLAALVGSTAEETSYLQARSRDLGGPVAWAA